MHVTLPFYIVDLFMSFAVIPGTVSKSIHPRPQT